jgi:putative transposase
MYAFIDEERALYGVEPICRVLAIAPSGYYTYRARQADPMQRPARAGPARVGAQRRRVWRA